MVEVCLKLLLLEDLAETVVCSHCCLVCASLLRPSPKQPPPRSLPLPAGVVCVGGDGVFHEAVNGLLQARAAAAAGGAHQAAELSALLSELRLAHIPAGSTDAVACTLHGSRSAFTAAVHVALGDAMPLDALRVDVGGHTRFACCIAGEARRALAGRLGPISSNPCICSGRTPSLTCKPLLVRSIFPMHRQCT